jgi:C4-dicarboxylate-specific signal transduction histidine kinase
MSRTIENFRNFFKPDKLKERFSINSALNEALGLIETTILNSDIKIIRKEEKEVFAYGFPNEFAQVILNILLNAKDVLCQREIQNPKITIEMHSEGKNSFLQITDNAGGISYDIMDKIFDPYFSTKNKVDGTGLGLYMSKMIIEKSMEGELLVKNKIEGASFIIKVKNVR